MPLKNTWLVLNDCFKAFAGQIYKWHPIRMGKIGDTQIKVPSPYYKPQGQVLSVCSILLRGV